MNRQVISSRFPYLPIHLHIRINGETGLEPELEALLDTGFDGDIIIPANFLSNNHPAEGYLRWTLADGSQVEAPAYSGFVSIGDIGPIEVVITALGDEPMIGRNAIVNLSVTLDYGQRVIVQS